MRDLSDWRPCERPGNVTLTGNLVVVEAWDKARHGKELWEALNVNDANKLMYYFPNEPFRGAEEFSDWVDGHNITQNYHTMVFRQVDNCNIVGMASYMRLDPKNGCIEVGAVAHGPAMSRSPISTEAHYLMAKYIFEDLGYRRYEWKLNNENQPSHNSAKRLGFTFEGVFRQHVIDKGRNRDTAWYAMLDYEWPKNKRALETWLVEDNFDDNGQQKLSLHDIREKL